jgi:hypothetical protein
LAVQLKVADPFVEVVELTVSVTCMVLLVAPVAETVMVPL